jgi:hypothetical protein
LQQAQQNERSRYAPREHTVVIDATTEQFLSRLRDAGVHGVPCNERAVSDVERTLDIQFPAAYRAFLLLAGNGWHPLEGSHYALDDDLAGLQRAGQRIAEHEKTRLPDDASCSSSTRVSLAISSCWTMGKIRPSFNASREWGQSRE